MTLPVIVTGGSSGIVCTRVEPVSATWSAGNTAQLCGRPAQFRAHPGFAERGAEGVVQRRIALGGRDAQHAADQVGDADGVAAGGGVPVGHDGVQRFGPRRQDRESWCGKDAAGQREVELTAPQRVQPCRQRQVDEHDVEGRCTLTQCVDAAFQAGGESGGGADAHCRVDGLVGGDPHLFGGHERVPCRVEHSEPRVGEPNPPRRPVEQLDAEFTFQPGDLLADGGLCDVQPLGGPPEVQLLGDRDEVPQCPQLHKARLSLRMVSGSGSGPDALLRLGM
jgi:hypothetical protein